MIKPIIMKMTEEENEKFYESNSGISIVDQNGGETIAQQIRRFYQNPRANPELLAGTNYDDDETIAHFLETGRMPFGRLNSDDYFEAVDRQKMLTARLEYAKREFAEEQKAEKEKAEKKAEKEALERTIEPQEPEKPVKPVKTKNADA